MKTSIEILRALDLFGALNDGELRKIHFLAREVTYKKGEVIIRENVPCDSLFIIKKGCVKITQGGKLLVVIGEGNPIGELSFIDKGLPSASGEADEDSIIIKIPSAAFDDLINRDGEIAAKVFRSMAVNLCQKLRDTNEWLATRIWLADIEKEAQAYLKTLPRL
ncbi:MAG: cyclic nucleotide-binding domain-containing protein [Thermodesulfovibrionales bacterium]|nr:cyclic nucleotide-binding domain-containing protein [Thermodesulfovibrionales bacterium]